MGCHASRCFQYWCWDGEEDVQMHPRLLDSLEVFHGWWKAGKIILTNLQSAICSVENISNDYKLQRKKVKWNSRLTGVSGKKLIESHPMPGTWRLPGVLQVACKALRALRVGVLGPDAVEVDGNAVTALGTFSLPDRELIPLLVVELLPVVCLLSVIYPLSWCIVYKQ